jgi:hypothetical protein
LGGFIVLPSPVMLETGKKAEKNPVKPAGF